MGYVFFLVTYFYFYCLNFSLLFLLIYVYVFCTSPEISKLLMLKQFREIYPMTSFIGKENVNKCLLTLVKVLFLKDPCGSFIGLT